MGLKILNHIGGTHMGGYAYTIKGVIDNEIYSIFKNTARDMPRKPIITSNNEVIRIRWSTSEKSVALPAEKYQILIKDFKDYIITKIEKPWLATGKFIQYLNLEIMDIYLGGKQRDSEPEPEFYIQVNFRDCAGMGEISSALATHWAMTWYSENSERILEQYLKPLGFKPNKTQECWTDRFIFLPACHAGYVLYNPNQTIDIETQTDYSKLFEIDYAAIDELKKMGNLKDFLYSIDEYFEEIVRDRKCKCQLCMPEFDSCSIDNALSKFFR